MKVSLVELLCLSVIGQLALARVQSTSSLSQEWSLYKRQHGKSYASHEEEARRFANFLSAKALVERYNADPDKSAYLRLNHMSDWDPEELDRLNGLRNKSAAHKGGMTLDAKSFLESILRQFDSRPVPDAVDWRKEPNRVGRVKDQGDCGSCWAFATTGLLEGQEVVHNVTSELVLLSEQDLVDCSELNNGCGGGIMDNALEDLKDMGGIDSEADYPYVAQETGTCKFNKKRAVMSVRGNVVLRDADEDDLKKYVAGYGPVAISMFASRQFIHYGGGVLVEDHECREVTPALDHGVLIVGYGTDPKAGDFWIVKNSWGTQWGEDGFFRINRGTNLCGVAQEVYFAMF